MGNIYDRLAAADARKHIALDPDLGPAQEIGGDWQLRSRDPEHKFAAANLSDDCIDAAKRAKPSLHEDFPGWELHSRIFRDDKIFDRRIAAWAIRMARLLARATKVNGRRHVGFVPKRARRSPWIAQCGIDAVEFLIAGRYSASANFAATQASVDNELYKRLRESITVLMVTGFDNYRQELYFQLAGVERENRRKLFCA